MIVLRLKKINCNQYLYIMLFLVIILIFIHIWLYKALRPFASNADRIRFWVMILIPFIGTVYHWYNRPNFKMRYELRKNSARI